MPPKPVLHMTSFKFSRRLLDALDAKARESTETSGFPVTRSDVVRFILERELLSPRQSEDEDKKKKARARRAA